VADAAGFDANANLARAGLGNGAFYYAKNVWRGDFYGFVGTLHSDAPWGDRVGFSHFAWLWLFLCGRTYAFVLGSMAAITFDVVRDRSVSFYFMLE
jgi:hypothetical protein